VKKQKPANSVLEKLHLDPSPLPESYKYENLVKSPSRKELENAIAPRKTLAPLHWPDIVKKLKEDGKEGKVREMRTLWEQIVIHGQKHFNESPKFEWNWDYLEREIFPATKPRDLPEEQLGYLPEDEEMKLEPIAQPELFEPMPEPPPYRESAAKIHRLPVLPVPRESRVGQNGETRGSGRRKTARAAVLLKPGEGKVTINGRHFVTYFDQLQWRHAVLEPFVVCERVASFDLVAQVLGGGKGCQAEALRLAIARALQKRDPSFRLILKTENLLTRDSRSVERKKPGQKKARKKFQWSKR